MQGCVYLLTDEFEWSRANPYYVNIERSMRKINTITAYLIPSPFRIKADRVFSGSNFTVTGNTVSCNVEFIACAYLLGAKRLSHFSFRSPCMPWLYFIMNRELSAEIYRMHDQYHTSVSSKSHWCQQSFKKSATFLINFTNRFIFI